MDKKYIWWAVAAFAVYYFFLRGQTRMSYGGQASIAVGTGANFGPAPPRPAGAGYTDTTAQTIASVGSLLGGVGTAAGSIMQGLGSLGYGAQNSFGPDSGAGSYDTDY